jgi:putative ABC transport system substrate-binding protein
VRRREFITLLCGTAVAWPLAARAQQPAMPVIGFLSSGTIPLRLVEVFRTSLGEVGYIEGKTVTFEHYPAGGDYRRFPELATELVHRRVAIILAAGGTPAALAAKAATGTIPIIFNMGGDPVAHGLVASLSRPGGNATGVSSFGVALGAKRLELIRSLVPKSTLIGLLANPSNPDAEIDIRDIRAAADTLGQQIEILFATRVRDFDSIFATAVDRRFGALMLGSDAFFNNQRDRLAALAARHALPTIYDRRDFAAAGGLASYGHDRADAFRQLGVYAGRILKGTKPADLPVVRPTKFEFVLNMKTAKALGLQIPDKVLALADEVIE